MNNSTMSPKRCKCSWPSPESLPVDLLLEIVARADFTTLVRCAATGKILRHAILATAFRRNLAADATGFDPTLLLGVSYREINYPTYARTQRVIQTPMQTQFRAHLDADCLRTPFKPVTSRDGLLVVRRHPYYDVELRTCDAFTAKSPISHPPSFPTRGSMSCSVSAMLAHCDYYCSAVIGRTVHWPCRVNYMQDWDQILALDADAGDATVMELPSGCSSNRLLLAQVRGQLCVLVQEESRGIAMWTLAPSVAGTWSRQVVISNMEIERQAGLGTSMYLLGRFGERSGVLILNVVLRLSNQTYRSPRYLIRLDLGTKEETPVVTCLATRGSEVYLEDLFLHEIDLNSLLQSMKHF
ncbi:hypothetical protein QYE76_061535 [Lolium multiflorum]|uniref:DUF7595 domain-containing protein n=1 Tax=Lolium multiflorum TaxID=4521 RepID=A0AAD8W6F1_LOLMU|nr:hypothetical protein QYE76_061535 [Lolium multiflorum]